MPIPRPSTSRPLRLMPVGPLILSIVLMAEAAARPAGPIIDAESLRWDGDRLVFWFRADEAATSDFEVWQTGTLSPDGSWQLAVGSTVEAVGPGLYRATLPRTDTGPLFARIRRDGPPPMGPSPVINEVMTDNVSAHADATGRFPDWIEIWNPHDEAVDLEGYGLTDDPARPGRWRFPGLLLQPDQHLVVFAEDSESSGVRESPTATFGLSSAGETLVLFDRYDREVDRVEVPPLAADQAVGRSPDGAETWQWFGRDRVTPGRPNPTGGEAPLIDPPVWSEEGGYHAVALDLELSARRPGETVRFTLDGSPPTVTSPAAAGPIRLERPVVVRAIVVDVEGRKSRESVRTFLIGVRHSLPVVSLAAPSNNFRFKDGYLFGMGSSVIGDRGQILQNYPYSGSNAWRDREIEVHLELFEPDGSVGLRQGAGLKVFGGWGSRGYPQKSLALFARRKYGAGRMEHRVFPESEVDAFESLVLRNSGNDNQGTHQTPPRPPITEFGATTPYGSYFVNGTFTLMRDALMQRLLVDDTTLDLQAYRPAVVYLNGEYWGLYNLREKMTEHYVSAHHGLESEQIDLIEGYGDPRAGDGRTYQAMREFVAGRSMTVETNYQFVASTYLEIDSFADYHLAVAYFQNFDIGNIKCWRPRVAGGRFRWMVYDQDYGFGLWPPEVYEPAMARDYADYRNMFRFSTAGSGTSTAWPNGGGRTLLLRRMLAHPGFRELFVRRCADLLNGAFREERVLSVIDEMAAAIRPEIADHLRRWSWPELAARGYGPPHRPEDRPLTVERWEEHVEGLREFARTRPGIVRADCRDHFQLKAGLGTVEVRVEPPAAGTVRVNSLRPDRYPWRGIYFGDYPTTLRPVARPGFVFVDWTTPTGQVSEARLEWTAGGDRVDTVTARFAPAPTPAAPAEILWITEINYHSPSDRPAEDWVEIHNPGNRAVELAGWVLRDDDDDSVFVIPEGRLEPGEYRVLCRNVAAFQLAHPGTRDPLGEFRFGLGNEGDTVRLFDPRGVPVDRVPYDDRAPWPREADGEGSTLQLVRPDLDHASSIAWSASSVRGGTPGGP